MNVSFGSCLLEASHVVFSKGYSVALALYSQSGHFPSTCYISMQTFLNSRSVHADSLNVLKKVELQE